MATCKQCSKPYNILVGDGSGRCPECRRAAEEASKPKQFFIKAPDGKTVSGPFPEPVVIEKLLRGELAEHSQAHEAQGQTVEALSQSTEWIATSDKWSAQDLAACKSQSDTARAVRATSGLVTALISLPPLLRQVGAAARISGDGHFSLPHIAMIVGGLVGAYYAGTLCFFPILLPLYLAIKAKPKLRDTLIVVAVILALLLMLILARYLSDSFG